MRERLSLRIRDNHINPYVIAFDISMQLYEVFQSDLEKWFQHQRKSKVEILNKPYINNPSLSYVLYAEHSRNSGTANMLTKCECVCHEEMGLVMWNIS
jgi:hypothetical protein